MNINRMYTNANKQSIAISDQNVDVDNQKYVDRKENDKERERAREWVSVCLEYIKQKGFLFEQKKRNSRYNKRQLVVIISV